MTSETVAEHTRPILKEVSQLTTQVRDLTEMVRGLAGAGAERDRKLDELAKAGAERHRTLTAEIQALKETGAERDRKLDEVAKAGAGRDRKLDVLSAQMRLVIGAFGLLVTALIAVFGILFTR